MSQKKNKYYVKYFSDIYTLLAYRIYNGMDLLCVPTFTHTCITGTMFRHNITI